MRSLRSNNASNNRAGTARFFRAGFLWVAHLQFTWVKDAREMQCFGTDASVKVLVIKSTSLKTGAEQAVS